MNKEKLLKIDDYEVFEEELMKISEKYETDIDMWDADLIGHYLKISDMTMEEFKNSFDPNYCPIDEEIEDSTQK